jgi:hypothetical protein
MDTRVRLPLFLLPPRSSQILIPYSGVPWPCLSYIERQLEFLKAIAPSVDLERPHFTREQIRLLAYEPDASKLPVLMPPHDKSNWLPRISMDERHAIEKIFREGPFIGELILLPFGFDC